MQFFKEGQKVSLDLIENILKACQSKLDKFALKIKFENPQDAKMFQQDYENQIKTIDIQEQLQDDSQQQIIKINEKKSKIETYETFTLDVQIALSVILKTEFYEQIQDIAKDCSCKILIIPSKIKIISENQESIENAVEKISELIDMIKCHSLKEVHSSQEVYNSQYYKRKLQPIQMVKVLNEYYIWYRQNQISKTIAQSKRHEIFERTQHRFYQFSVDRAGNFQLNKDSFYKVKQNIADIDCTVNPTKNKYSQYIRIAKNRQTLDIKKFLLLKLKGRMFINYFSKDINRLREQSKAIQLSMDESALILHCDAKQQFIMAEMNLQEKYKSYFYFLIQITQERENQTGLYPELQKIIKEHESENFVCYGEQNKLWIALKQQKIIQCKQLLSKLFNSLGLISIGAFKNEVELITYENPKFTIQFENKWLCNFTLKVRNQLNYKIFYDEVFINIMEKKKKVQEEGNSTNAELSNVQYDSINITHSINQSTTFIDADQSTLNMSNMQQQAILISMKKQKNLSGRLAQYNTYIPDTQGKNKYKQIPKLSKIAGKPQKQFEAQLCNITKGNKYKAYNVEIPQQYKIEFENKSEEGQILDRIVTVFIPESEFEFIYSQSRVKAYLLQSYHKISKNGYLANCKLNLLKEVEQKQSFQLQPKTYQIFKYLKYLK